MKLTIFIILILTLLMLSACSTTEEMPDENDDVDDDSDAGQDVNANINLGIEDPKPEEVPCKVMFEVCGNDGVTYPSECAVEKAGVGIKYYMACPFEHVCTQAEKQHKECVDDRGPVCGSDWVTYDSGCDACYARVDSWIGVSC